MSVAAALGEARPLLTQLGFARKAAREIVTGGERLLDTGTMSEMVRDLPGLAQRARTAAARIDRTVSSGRSASPAGIWQAQQGRLQFEKSAQTFEGIVQRAAQGPNSFGETVAMKYARGFVGSGTSQARAALNLLDNSGSSIASRLADRQVALRELAGRVDSIRATKQLRPAAEAMEAEARSLRALLPGLVAKVAQLPDDALTVHNPLVWNVVGIHNAAGNLETTARVMRDFARSRAAEAPTRARKYAESFVNATETTLGNAARGLPHDELTMRTGNAPIAFLRSLGGAAK